MSADVRISPVERPMRELRKAVHKRFPLIKLVGEEVLVDDEALASFGKRGTAILLAGRDEHEPLIHWVAWAIAQVCPGSMAADLQSGEELETEPHQLAEIERLIAEVKKQRLVEEARDVPGGAGDVAEAAALLTYLVTTEKLELNGPQEPLVEPVARLLEGLTRSSASKLEALLLDADVVEELYADANELFDTIYSGAHLG